ncbi:Lnb N-terminal periplasmic domain-containing protein [Pigmentiphaga litoralis]|uniref:Lnb N-terminal periplasmic domain-containing protein n=1 Tax=Pigmentiphaga litoralis TaxID=516702 RepID=A0A7Y9LPI8_9BURK|nr:DUF4105 domain-containing protein [Pigmentiphaga litoralis]NYE26578.1 hypothetical protein [Pigmentiphaga litoralis]NYE86012.1 hypothetical protein [Pigmentiphaga litoralis]
MSRLRTFLTTCLLALASVTTFLSAAWGAMALWYQVPFPPAVKAALVAAWVLIALTALGLAWRERSWLGFAAYAVAFVLLSIWWNTLTPSNNRQWADDVASMTSGTINGNLVTLQNVRNFDWRTETDYTPRWERRDYDLDRLASVDMILSSWGLPGIAHTLVSFGFDDGRYLTFSVEIRKEKNESFSAIGGFFKEFEMSVVAADERDIIRVRTNVRQEDDHLFRVQVSKDTMRSLFLAYVAEANSLVHTPRFYHTVTANCTTIVYHMMARIVGGLPMDYRLLLSSMLDGYVYDAGALTQGYPLETLRERGRITDRARAADADPDFSIAIRRGIPGADPAVEPRN